MKTKKHRTREYLQYRFDRFISSGPKSIFIALIVMFSVAFTFTALVRISVSALVPTQYDEKGNRIMRSLDENLWLTLMQITDPGAIEQDTNNGKGLDHWIFRGVGLFTILTGLVFFSAVIAFITTQLEEKIKSLKKGRSNVIVSDHILILGFTERTLDIVRELIEALKHRFRSHIVILAEKEKDEMDDFFKRHVPERGNTKIITRRGNPSSLEALNRVAVTDAHSVIVMPFVNEASPDEDKEISDSKVIKTVLGIVAALSENAVKPNIIAQTYSARLNRVLEDLSTGNIHILDIEDTIAKIIVQTSRSVGLSTVYSELISFSGMEFYFAGHKIAGTRFVDACYLFDKAILSGVHRADTGLLLNPGREYSIRPEDRLVLLSDSEAVLSSNATSVVKPAEYPFTDRRIERRVESELIIGWNSKAARVIREYYKYIPEESRMDLLLHQPTAKVLAEVESLRESCPGRNINIIRTNPTSGEELEELNLTQYDNIIILNKIEDDFEKVDSGTIVILLLIRGIFKKYEKENRHKVRTKLITEVMNSDNLELVSKTGVNDFIISNQMISKVYAQVAMDPSVLYIYTELFNEEGSEIYLKPLVYYFELPIPENLHFADVMHAAFKRGEVAIGYRLKRPGTLAHEGVVLNPPKHTVLDIGPEDFVIVIAENEL